MVRPKRFELLTPRFVVWWGPLKSLKFVTERIASVEGPLEFSILRHSDCYRKIEFYPKLFMPNGSFNNPIGPARTVWKALLHRA
jgi:hypothetical protein